MLHGEQAGLRVFAEDARRRARQPAPDRARPCGLRRLPQGRDLQLAQGALDAKAPSTGFDEANVGTRRRRSMSRQGDLAGVQQTEAAQGNSEIAAWRERRRRQYVARPPERSKTAPVENEHSRLASQQISAAASSTVPKRSIGIFERM